MLLTWVTAGVAGKPVYAPYKKLNSVVLVRKRTIPTERPQHVGEVNTNFSW
jgi:hypothetical protein